MSNLKVLLGKAHTGKSSWMLSQIEQHMQRGEHAILIVPEQTTYYYEKRLCAKLGGLIGIEVYGFERLCQRLIEHAGSTLPTLSDQGRYMVLRRAAYKHRDSLQLFSRASQLRGFSSSMDTHIGRFKKSCITPDMLENALTQIPKTDLLHQKLTDICVLYRESESFLERRFLTSSDLLSIATPLIPSSFLKDCYVYLDDLDHLDEQIYRLIQQILLSARGMTVALRWGDEPDLSDLFSPDRHVYDRLLEMCSQYGIPFFERKMTELSQTPAPALLHLENNLFSERPSVFSDSNDAVSILEAKDRRTEAALIADQILISVRSGKRFSDFAIIASDLDSYGPVLRREFEQRGIPLFYDAVRPVSGLPSSDFILSIARTVCLGFSMSDILRILKSGYAGVSPDDTELFENYVLQYGIYGSELKKPFSAGEIPSEAERVRIHLMEHLLPLYEAIGSKKTSDKVRALWACLNIFGLREQLEEEAKRLLEDGYTSEAQLTAQVWSAIRELLRQTDTVLGETEISQKEFPMLLEEGLYGLSIGILPERGDAVILGDLTRSRLAPVDTLFLAGCSEGLFPPMRSNDGLINDDELEKLRSAGLSVWEGTVGESAMDRLSLYTLISKARSRIILSYPFSDGNSELVPSPLISLIRSLFPGISDTVGMGRLARYPVSKAVAFSELSELISEWKQDGKCPPDLPLLLRYFESEPDYSQAVSDLMAGSAANVSPGQLDKRAARALYGSNLSMSASRLELYARCPFAQYLKYGLNAEERKVATEKASDSGTFLHDALDTFVKSVESGSFSWDSITDEEIDSLLDTILPMILASHNDGIFLHDPRLRESLFLRIRTIRLCAHTIARQLKAGRFEVAQTEMSFGMDGPFAPVWITLSDGTKVRIYGKIDRVDRTPDGKLMRIIDYKMGQSHKFDPTLVMSGEALQLPLYFLAAKQLGGECAGFYYMPLTLDPPEPGQTSEHLLYGLTVSEGDAVSASEEIDKKSRLIYNLKKDPDGTYSGSVADRQQMETVISKAEQIAAQQASGILNGHAEILPTSKACTWCPYHSVCRFDKQTGGKNRYIKKVELSELLGGKEEQA